MPYRVCSVCKIEKGDAAYDHGAVTCKSCMRTPGKRVCCVCRLAKPLSEFQPRLWRCKSCDAEQTRQVREERVLLWHDAEATGTLDSTTQVCQTCGAEKSLSLFGRGEYRCKVCCRLRTRERNRKPGGRYASARHIAKRRGIAFTITLEEYTALRARPCEYCGGELPETGMAIDRADNSGTYETGNVVPCCDVCNLVKGAEFSYAEMRVLGKGLRAIRLSRGGTLRLRKNRGRPRLSDDA